MRGDRPILGALGALALLGAALLSASCGGGLPGKTPDERAVAAADLGVMDANENIPLLLQAITEDQEIVQIQAINSIGRIGTEEAVAALAQVADHESRVCRETVAIALRDVKPESYPKAAEVLVAMGEKHLPRGDGSDPNVQVRKAVVTSLGVIKQPSSAEFLVNRLEHEHEETIRNAAVLTLGRLGDPRAVDVLIEVFRKDNQKNRSWAIESLGSIGDPRGLPIVEEALDDYDPVCRGKAAWSLMQLRGEDARAALSEALEREEDDMPAVVIAHALHLLGDERAIELIEERAMLAESNFARAEACRVLGEIGRRETIPILDKVFNNDRDGLVKRESSVAIRKLLQRFPPEGSGQS